jgi:hypothetical protein
MPACLVHAPPAIDATSFAAADVFFFDTFPVKASPLHETSLSVPSPHTLMDGICNDNDLASITYDDNVLFIYRDVVTHSRARHTLRDGCLLDVSHIPFSNDFDDCPSLVSDSGEMICTDNENDVLQMAIRTVVRPLPMFMTVSRSSFTIAPHSHWTPEVVSHPFTHPNKWTVTPLMIPLGL